MYKKYFFYFVFFFLCQVSFIQAQVNGPLNQYNTRHKKTGYWKIFFSDELYVTDSANARYFGYDYYANGRLVLSCIGNANKKKNFARLESPAEVPVKGRPIALEGLIRMYDSNGLSDEILYKDGICLIVSSFYSGSNVVLELIDYTQRYKGNPYSFRHQLRKGDGSLYTDEWLFLNEKKGKLVSIKVQ